MYYFPSTKKITKELNKIKRFIIKTYFIITYYVKATKLCKKHNKI